MKLWLCRYQAARWCGQGWSECQLWQPTFALNTQRLLPFASRASEIFTARLNNGMLCFRRMRIITMLNSFYGSELITVRNIQLPYITSM